MFKVVVHFDNHTYGDRRESYEAAFELLISLDMTARSLRASNVIKDYYVELIKEAQ